MKELNVKKVCAACIPADAVPALLDEEKIPFQPIDTVNWAEYPYRPSAQFRLAYTADSILLHYKVKEDAVRALAAADNGPVWEDSCVEFFFIPAADGIYYNVECNCAGTLLIGAGTGRKDRKPAPQAVLDTVQRWASLGREPFAEREGACCWEVALILPYSAFFLHDTVSLEGKALPANFYKCGDCLPVPHFLSWNPIAADRPDFHRPECFGLVRFG